MADQIVITEKTSQAKDVRAAVGSRYGEILPAEGHLFDLIEPEDVVPAWKRWSPILLRPEGLYGTRPAEGGNKAAKLRAIREALRTAKRVWLATDCDREGQLIGQEILEHYEYRGEVMRVLFTAQDSQTIRDAFGRAKPNAEYAKLCAAAVARRQADQIYNLSLKGIGTPATRAEIIGGLKKQGFLNAQGKNIVPTEAGLTLFGILKQADPALVDPGVRAQLECLLDDVVTGKQEMVGAIDAVCDVAQRIIGKLKDGAAAGGLPSLGATAGNSAAAYPPTPAMKRFAESLVRQKGIKPPPGYKTSISICRKFLSEHAPKEAGGETAGNLALKPVSPAQLLYAKKIAQRKGLIIPEEAKASSTAMSAWIDSNRDGKRRRRKSAYKPVGSAAPQSAGPTKRSRKRKAAANAPPSIPAQRDSMAGTPLRIPYGHKDVAMKLGARYGSAGWYAPPGIDLSAFGERGWL